MLLSQNQEKTSVGKFSASKKMHYYTKVVLNIWFYSSLLKKEKKKKTTSVNNSLCAQPFVDRVGLFCSMARCIFSFLESLTFEFTELLSWKAVKSARIDLSIVTYKFWLMLKKPVTFWAQIHCQCCYSWNDIRLPNFHAKERLWATKLATKV